MKINFTLFGIGLTGGTFNLVEPAHRLALRGHEVTVTTIGRPTDFAWFLKRKKPAFKILFAPVTGSVWYRAFRRITRSTFVFPMPEAEIRSLVAAMPDCDVNIATAGPTAFAVHRSGKGKGFYYIQHYDSFFGKDGVANCIHDESYFLPLTKIAVSSWLKKSVEGALHVPVQSVITAGIDETVFYPRPRPLGRKLRILSLGRKVDWKGFAELRAAMKMLFDERDDFEWVVYSAHDTPVPSLEAPFTLIQSPYGADLAELYASCDITVNPSWHEGFAQPALEAMACGSAVITTPIGAEDFMEDGVNCLVIEPKNSAQVRAAIKKLLDDEVLRIRIAAAGTETAKHFHWDRIIDKWEAVLK